MISYCALSKAISGNNLRPLLFFPLKSKLVDDRPLGFLPLSFLKLGNSKDDVNLLVVSWMSSHADWAGLDERQRPSFR